MKLYQTLPLFICGILCLPTSLLGLDRTPEQVKAAKEFTFEGIGFATTLAQLKAKWPDLEQDVEKSDAKIGLAVWKTYSIKAGDRLRVSLLDGKIYKLEVFYMPATLTKWGGWRTLYERLVAKYGKEDEDSPGENSKDEDVVADYTWQVFDAERYFGLLVTKKAAEFTIADKQLSRKLTEKRKSKADVGF